ncbi:hypothetical protein RA086_13715 [Lactiplantibacillus sp. WILCCON 0030]|uniref:PTS EIIA type-1 domain-containing protein n=1 Tax=Lactiplantibacillus brownii TaxID=3069269 RepID=A0ABU1ACK0_9LACO|nr:hypothetical protein [Lactiplantibacillus brownii]MDQ7938667.1 hypothetical protein [Lactiplantibacillus brownii]
MTVIKRIIHIELPANSVYHVCDSKHKLQIVMKCDDLNIYAPISGHISAYSRSERTIRIVADNSKTSLLMQLPAVSDDLVTFYINQGERVTQGLKLADLKTLSSTLSITTIDLDENCHYEICKRQSLT